MNSLTHGIIKILTYIIPGLNKTKGDRQKEYKYENIGRNSSCYCNSGKKYKHCHLIKNEKKGKVAVKYWDSKGIERVKIFTKQKFNIEVKNTYTEIEVGMGAN